MKIVGNRCGMSVVLNLSQSLLNAQHTRTVPEEGTQWNVCLFHEPELLFIEVVCHLYVAFVGTYNKSILIAAEINKS